MKSAVSHAAAHLRTISARTIRERYAISHANVTANANVKISYNYHDGAQSEVIFNGRRIPLYRFDGAAPKQPVQRADTRGHALKSTSPYHFAHAFVARMPGGHIGIFERTGGETSKGKDEIREFLSPAVPQMVGNQEVAEKLAKESMETFEKRLLENVNAILYGYMRV